MEDNEHIDKHLKNSLDGYMVPPRITSFDDILLKMKKKRRRRFLIFFFPGLLFLIGGMFLVTNNFSHTKDLKEHDLLTVSGDRSANNATFTEKPPAPGSASINGTTPRQNQASSVDQSPPLDPDKPDTQKKYPVMSGHSAHKMPGPGNVNARIPLEEKKQEQIRSQKQEQAISVVNAIPQPIKPDTLDVDFLESKQLLLPQREMLREIVLMPLWEPVVTGGRDSTKKQKPLRFAIGLAFNPQLGSYHLQKNKNTWYDETSQDMYLKTKKEQNKGTFDYAFGLKMGMIVRDKWEILLGLGFQKYTQLEKITTLVLTPSTAGSGPSPNGTSGTPQVSAFLAADPTFGDFPAEPGRTYRNEFRYWDYSLEVNRFFTLKNGLRTKLGLGLHSQRRTQFLSNGSQVVVVGENSGFYISDGYINAWQIARSLSVIHLKAGLIEDLNKTIQVQFCPTLQYSLNSMYAKNYLIRQKSIGLGLECLLLFKIL